MISNQKFLGILFLVFFAACTNQTKHRQSSSEALSAPPLKVDSRLKEEVSVSGDLLETLDCTDLKLSGSWQLESSILIIRDTGTSIQGIEQSNTEEATRSYYKISFNPKKCLFSRTFVKKSGQSVGLAEFFKIYERTHPTESVEESFSIVQCKDEACNEVVPTRKQVLQRKSLIPIEIKKEIPESSVDCSTLDLSGKWRESVSAAESIGGKSTFESEIQSEGSHYIGVDQIHEGGCFSNTVQKTYYVLELDQKNCVMKQSYTRYEKSIDQGKTYQNLSVMDPVEYFKIIDFETAKGTRTIKLLPCIDSNCAATTSSRAIVIQSL